MTDVVIGHPNRSNKASWLLFYAIIAACISGVAYFIWLQKRTMTFDPVEWKASKAHRWQMIDDAKRLLRSNRLSASEVFEAFGSDSAKNQSLFEAEVRRYHYVEYTLTSGPLDNHEHTFVIGFDESDRAVNGTVNSD